MLKKILILIFIGFLILLFIFLIKDIKGCKWEKQPITYDPIGMPMLAPRSCAEIIKDNANSLRELPTEMLEDVVKIYSVTTNRGDFVKKDYEAPRNSEINP